jgi:hypothetical protein
MPFLLGLESTTSTPLLGKLWTQSKIGG